MLSGVDDVPRDCDADWLSAQYRLGEVHGSELAARGAMGEIYRLTTSTGTYAAKVFFWEALRERDAEWVVHFTDQCRGAGVPSPATLRSTADSVLSMSPRSGLVWQVQKWAPGRVPDCDDVPAAVWLAQQMAAIHRLVVPGPHDDVDPWYTEVQHDWDRLAAAAERAGAGWAGRLTARKREFRELSALVNSVGVGERVACHRDLKAVNTLVTEDGRRWLLDWDNCGPQQPWRELGTVLMDHVGNDTALRQIAMAYREAGGPGWPRTADLFATGLAVWLNFLHGQAQLALDETAEPQHRVFAEERIAALILGVPSLHALESAAGQAARARRP